MSNPTTPFGLRGASVGSRKSEVLLALLGIVLLWAPGCAQPPSHESIPADSTSAVSPRQDPPVRTDYGYDFSSPDVEFKLDNDLVEISGLTLFDENHLAAIEDEHGKFYLIEIETGEISAVHRFAGKDDYEGIEMAGERLFALRSDGQIREIKNYDTDNPDSDKIETHLHSKCDAEGLAHDAAGNRLLIACKEHPGKGFKRLAGHLCTRPGIAGIIRPPCFHDLDRRGAASRWIGQRGG